MALRLVLLTLLPLATEPALAQLVPAKKLCDNFGSHFSLDDVVFGCSAVIKDEKASPTELASAFSTRGYILGLRGEFDSALADHGKAIELSPKDAWFHVRRGYTLYAKSEVDGAIADFTKAIALSPAYALPYIERGRILFRRGEYDSAIVDCTAAIKLTPREPYAHSLCGSAQRVKGNLDLAIEESAKALELKPQDPELANSLGFAWYLKGDLKNALRFLRPDAPVENQAYFILIQHLIQARTGDPKAAADLERNAAARAIVSKDWPYAAFELYLGKLSTAETLAAATTAEHRCEAHFYIGERHLLKGETGTAVTELKIAMDTCPKYFIEHAAAQAELQRIKP
jgi:Flp pilus assembly protein TadD